MLQVRAELVPVLSCLFVPIELTRTIVPECLVYCAEAAIVIVECCRILRKIYDTRQEGSLNVNGSHLCIVCLLM